MLIYLPTYRPTGGVEKGFQLVVQLVARASKLDRRGCGEVSGEILGGGGGAGRRHRHL